MGGTYKVRVSVLALLVYTGLTIKIEMVGGFLLSVG
jgi:hypothetical protein